MFDIGVGIVFRTCCGVGGLAVFGQELHFLHCLAVLGVALAIEHKALGHIVEFLFHQGHFHLVLDLLDGDAVVDIEMGKYFGQRPQIDRTLNGIKSLDDGIHNFVEREPVGTAVALGNCQNIVTFHYC